MPGHLDGLPATVDIVGYATRQPRHLNIPGLSRDALHRGKIAGAGGGKTRFHHVHAQNFKLVGKTQFFLQIHGGAGRLLPVAQGGIEKIHAVVHGVLLWLHKGWIYRA